MEDEAKTIDIYCPTCNVQVAASILFTHAYAEPEHGGTIGDLCDTPHNVTTYSLSECSRCHEVFLTKAEFYEIPGEVCAPQTGDITLYPLPRNLGSTVFTVTGTSTISFTLGQMVFDWLVTMLRTTSPLKLQKKMPQTPLVFLRRFFSTLSCSNKSFRSFRIVEHRNRQPNQR